MVNGRHTLVAFADMYVYSANSLCNRFNVQILTRLYLAPHHYQYIYMYILSSNGSSLTEYGPSNDEHDHYCYGKTMALTSKMNTSALFFSHGESSCQYRLLNTIISEYILLPTSLLRANRWPNYSYYYYYYYFHCC